MPRKIHLIGIAALLTMTVSATTPQITRAQTAAQTPLDNSTVANAPAAAPNTPVASPDASSSQSAVSGAITPPTTQATPITPSGPMTTLAPQPQMGPPPPIPALKPEPITTAIPTEVDADNPVGGTAPAAAKQIAKPYATVPPVMKGAPIETPDKEAGPTFTLDDVVNQVLKANPAIIQAVQAAQAAHAQIGEATGQLLPQFDLTGGDTYSGIATSAFSGGSIGSISQTGSIPSINDSSFNSLQSGSSQSLSSSTGTILSAGSGASTTSTTTTTIVPPVNLGGSSSSSGGATSSTSGSNSSIGSSTSVSPGSFGTSDTSSGGSTTSNAVTRSQGLKAGSNATGTGTTGTTGTGTTGTTTITSAGTEVFSNKVRHDNYGVTGTVTQYLDVFGLGRANVNVAKESAKFYDLDLIRVANDTVLSAKDTYYAIIRAQSDVQTAEEQLRNAQATLKDAEIEYQAGAQPEYNVVSAQAEVASAEQTLIQSRNNLDIERADLNNYLNRPVDARFNVSPAPYYVIPSNTPVDREIAAAFQGRPEMQQATLTQDIAKNVTKLAHQGQLPSFGLSGGVTYLPYGSSSSLTSGDSHYTEEITAAVNFPFFDGGQTRSRVKAARINQDSQHTLADQLVQNISLEVRTALSNIIDAQSLVTSDQSAVAEYREALRLARIRYTAGVGTLLEVTNAEANLASSEESLNNAVYQQQSAYAALQRAEGKR